MPKTGTTFLQSSLWANQGQLRSQGIDLAGNTYYSSVEAGRHLLAWRPELGEVTPGTWQRLVKDASRRTGRASVISQEFLVQLDQGRIKQAMEAFPSHVDVRVVITARDLARQIPAQWQTAIRGGKTWTLEHYADSVAGRSHGPQARRAGRHFWSRQALDVILDSWAGVVGIDNVTLLTVPAPGADPSELWLRFCRSCNLDPSTLMPAPPTHESLGAASVEVMRLLNAHPLVGQLPRSEYKRVVNHTISRQVLQSRRHLEPRLGLQRHHWPWVDLVGARMIEAVRRSGVEVVGSLSDLTSSLPEADPVVPDQLAREELLEAALDAIVALRPLAHQEADVSDMPAIASADTHDASARLGYAIDELALLATAMADSPARLDALIHHASERSRSAARLRAFVGRRLGKRP